VKTAGAGRIERADGSQQIEAVAEDAGVRIRLLGGFEVTVGDCVLASDAWRLRKAKTLVKLLVLADGHRMHREALVGLLWPERDDVSGSNNLHQVLYVARRVLAGGSGGGSGVLICLRDDVVLLSDGAMPWLDVEAFDAAGRRARETRDPDDYRSAVELYRGDLLPEDQFEIWAEGPREALRERRLGLLVEYAEVLAKRGEHTEVVEVVGAVTAADPFHEGAYRALMTALAASGRRYEALSVFDRLREALTREYAADPEPATRRLYRDLLTGATPPADALDPAALAPRPDTDRTHRAAPRRGVASAILEQTSFIGRGREITEIARTLDRTRLLTLTGPGGAGKTRLACEVAAGLVDHYFDGVHVAELASLSRPELVPHSVASVLDVPLPEIGTAEAALARQLADRRLLLVLDNCEHLLDACARLVAEFLRTCPGVIVLATSREPLRVGGEVTWRTPSLALPDLRTMPPLDRLAELESVRLFVERAHDAAPDFVLDESTAPAVAEICVRLDGMPLALELAAARTSALAPSQIAVRLGDALRVLDRGSRSAVNRQQTLQATLAWSHDLLDPDERVLFRRLAVFAGSMALESVEQICGGDGLDTVDVLSRLVDKSLVQVEHAGGTARYRLLETIRQFADQQLRDAGEKAERIWAHREWYVAFATAHDPELAVGVVNDTPQALDAEHDNLRAALSSGLAEDPAVALKLAVSLWRFWLARGHFSEGSRWLAATLAAAPDRTATRARALLCAAAMELRRGGPAARQLDLGVEAVAIMRADGDDRALAQTLHLAGMLAWVVDDGWQQAVDLVDESRLLAAAAADVGAVANASHTLGVIALARGASARAEEHFSEVLGLLDGLAADLPSFFSALTPGFFWEPGRQGGTPRLPFTETVLLFRRVGTEQAVAYTLANLSYAASLGGDPARARELLEDSLSAFTRRGDLHGEALALCRLANVHRVAGQLPEATELLERSLGIRHALGDRRAIGISVMNQGLVAAAAGDLEEADRLLREALLVFDETEDGPGRWGTLLDLGLVLLDAGEHERARRVLRQWQNLPPAWTFRPRAWALLSLAALERYCGDEVAAARCLNDARRGFLALADAPGLAYLDSHPEPLLSGR
jgi:predicted ATPase/DNA-binding SARP family transcriptional activator